ncbi:MAG: type I-E CRISPR-associated endonuclease Cas1e [Spirochaetales bacterium]|uniref:CRISPR-associated endonuclease Cas1 n=1 Tax=Candidatus Thalassospirochaeta sargassi TaxID=3119039 RepID=A0AAJ1MJJ8_9SPIO|nr:type I-E CRISPR-associated endonuclease Cas1e [Spirochaetales bacterium]
MYTLSNLKDDIPPQVFKRGVDLFENGKIKTLEKNEHDWFAVVEGSKDYYVQIELDGEFIKYTDCECPYEQGPLCKHRVAVLLAIEAQLENDSKKKKTSERRKIKSRPIPLKERISILYLEKCQIDVIDGSFVTIDKNGVRTHIPIGGITCLMLEPGIRISHAAVSLAAEVGCLIVWCGDGGVRLYSAGQPGGARADKLLYQARLALDESLRIKVVKAMYEYRFKEKAPERRSIQQLRGVEGARVRAMYKLFAKQYSVEWNGRNYNPKAWDESDIVNQCLSTATHCLYGICEAAVLAAGYAPAIGFIHTGKPRSFVYDIADIFKFETVVPVAFMTAKNNNGNPVRETRIACRNIFREKKILKKIIPVIEEILSSGGIDFPGRPKEAVPVAILDEEGIGDAGHRD